MHIIFHRLGMGPGPLQYLNTESLGFHRASSIEYDPKIILNLFLKVFSGASVNKHIGDMLATEGVVMHPFWGRHVVLCARFRHCRTY